MLDKFAWRPSDIKTSQCVNCVKKYSEQMGCEAFPDGVPEKYSRTDAYMEFCPEKERDE